MGPTASGKTGLAVDLVRQFPLEIISVDSALVYRGMDIGTAKPDAGTQAIAPHHLIDIIDPAERYSAADFCRDARQLIGDIHGRGNTPLLVGGTMLYFHALLDGLSVLPEADARIRLEIEHEAERTGWQALHKKLQRVDPAAADRIQPGDQQRIQRALEVWQITGESLTGLQAQQRQKKLPFPSCKMVVCPSLRSVLHERISQRFVNMLKQGFLDEMNSLFKRSDLKPELPSV
jgi:tRNA dimethylallyltransferase